MECLDLVDDALRLNDSGRDLSADWLVGSGAATSLHETAPPTDHISDAWATLRDDGIYEIAVGTVEYGEGTSTVHVQIAATNLNTTPDRIHLVQSDTDRTGFDTGAAASSPSRPRTRVSTSPSVRSTMTASCAVTIDCR